MENTKYDSHQDYCDSAMNFQAVPSYVQYKQNHPDVPDEKIDNKRAETLYSCPDDYHMGTIQDDHIYIATTDKQHDQIVDHQTNPDQKIDAQGGLSGYFSDQATVDACEDGNSLDNTKYNEACQIAPHRQGGWEGGGDASYKPHVDCFEIDRDRLYEVYDTRDFNAAVAKCEANNQFGSGGGNQGYNPHISEMIENGSLNYSESHSYSDNSISKSRHNNPNQLTNSVVPENKADAIYDNAHARASDCVKNNTPHPSPEACNNGFPKDNAIKLNSDTGHAVPINNHTNSNSSTINSQNVTSTTGGGARAPDVIDTSNDLAKRGKVESAPETKFNSEDNVKRGKIESSPNTEPSPESEPKRGRVANTDVDPNTFKVANDTSKSAASSSTGMSTSSIT